MYLSGRSEGDITPRVGIVITDGFSNVFPENTPLAAQAAKQFPNPTTMYAIGVGSNVNQEEISSIASVPAERYAIHLSNYDELFSVTTFFSQEICSASEYGFCYMV